MNFAHDIIKAMDILDNSFLSGTREKKGRRAAAAANAAAAAAAPNAQAEISDSNVDGASAGIGLLGPGGPVGGAFFSGTTEEELTIATVTGAGKIDNGGDGMDTPPRYGHSWRLYFTAFQALISYAYTLQKPLDTLLTHSPKRTH